MDANLVEEKAIDLLRHFDGMNTKDAQDILFAALNLLPKYSSVMALESLPV